MPLGQLIYISRRTEDLTLDVLNEIVAHSRFKNTQNGVTGVLLCSGRELMQLLEGEPSRIEAIFTRIKTDPRHCEVKCIYSKPVKRRLCAEWSMELFDLRTKAVLDSARMERLIADVRASNDTGPHGVEARILLSDFKQQLPCDPSQKTSTSKVA